MQIILDHLLPQKSHQSYISIAFHDLELILFAFSLIPEQQDWSKKSKKSKKAKKKKQKKGRTLSLKKQFPLVQVEIALDYLNAWSSSSSNLKQP